MIEHQTLSDIFDINYGTKLDMNKMSISDSSKVAFVSRSSKNNGVVEYVDKINDIDPLPSGLITVTLGGTYVLSAFLQETPFYTAQNVAVLKAKTDLTVEEKLYYCMCISKNRFRYSAFGREANRTLKSIIIPSIKEIPNWINNSNLKRYSGSAKAKINKVLPVPVIFKSKRLSELFSVFNGLPSSKVNVSTDRNNGYIPYMRPASTLQRTVAGYVSIAEIDKKHIYPKETLFVSTDGEGSHSFSYVSLESFVPNSNVAVLIPKSLMSLELKLYYAKCITQNRYLFSYGRKPKGKRLAGLSLPKPTPTETKEIEEFMKSLNYSINL